jgi:hypothetical protein
MIDRFTGGRSPDLEEYVTTPSRSMLQWLPSGSRSYLITVAGPYGTFTRFPLGGWLGTTRTARMAMVCIDSFGVKLNND